MTNQGHNEALMRWYQTEPGRSVYSVECELLNTVLGDLFGYYLLQLGCFYDECMLMESRIPVKLSMAHREMVSGENSFVGGADNLPVSSDSIDVVLLPHTLELDDHPHQVLRETDRVLIPEGHVIIMGFNPLSPWWLWSRVSRGGMAGMSLRCLISPLRVQDWLKLLGFKVVAHQGYFASYKVDPPGKEKNGFQRHPLFSAAYMIVAKKKVSTLTPIKPRWRLKRRVLAPGVVETYNR